MSRICARQALPEKPAVSFYVRPVTCGTQLTAMHVSMYIFTSAEEKYVAAVYVYIKGYANMVWLKEFLVPALL